MLVIRCLHDWETLSCNRAKRTTVDRCILCGLKVRTTFYPSTPANPNPERPYVYEVLARRRRRGHLDGFYKGGLKNV